MGCGAVGGWKQLPKAFGDDSSVNRSLKRWVRDDVSEILRPILINEGGELAGVACRRDKPRMKDRC